MPLDQALYRQAYEGYRQMNEAEECYRVQHAGQLPPQEAWRQFVALVEFCWKLAPPPTERQQRETMDSLTRYYERLQILEAWRLQYGKAS